MTSNYLCIHLCIYSDIYAVAGVFSYPNSSSCISAAICAVVAVHVIMAMFVYVAWNSEPQTSRRPAAAAAAADKLD